MDQTLRSIWGYASLALNPLLVEFGGEAGPFPSGADAHIRAFTAYASALNGRADEFVRRTSGGRRLAAAEQTVLAAIRTLAERVQREVVPCLATAASATANPSHAEALYGPCRVIAAELLGFVAETERRALGAADRRPRKAAGGNRGRAARPARPVAVPSKVVRVTEHRVVVSFDLMNSKRLYTVADHLGGADGVATFNDVVREMGLKAALDVTRSVAKAKLAYEFNGDGGAATLASVRLTLSFLRALYESAAARNGGIARWENLSDLRFRFRAGVDCGKVVVGESRHPDGLYHYKIDGGLAVVNANRLQQAAPPGGILISPAAYAELSKPLRALFGPEQTFHDKGKEEIRAHSWTGAWP